jgi:hypothetical protein
MFAMTHTARAELTDVVRRRYCAATGAEKRKILDEFIAVTGYHQKSAIRALNAEPIIKRRQIRVRPALYDEAVQAALIVLWEASDRVCGKRLRALLPILLPALERNGHLHLREPMRQKILAMSASTIDRLLRMPRSATHLKKRRRAMPEARRRVPVRTFADWNEPPPGSMEMDCVAHCGDVNRGSYINSLVVTDIASGWTEAAPMVVRESGLLVETLEHIRQGLPFALRALDVDNGSEFVNESLINYCLSHGIELTRSRPYRKNDQAKLREVAGALDPLKLLEEMRAVQAHLVMLADGETPPSVMAEPPDLSAFVSGLSSAWRAGEIRPTFSVEAKPRYLRSLQAVVQQDVAQMRPKNVAALAAVTQPAAQTPHSMPAAKTPERPQLIYAGRGMPAFHALKMVRSLVCRRLEGCPNITSTQLFEELCTQFPGRFHPWQVRRLMKRVKVWRRDARARGVVIGPLKYRCVSKKPRGRGAAPERFKAHCPEMLQYLEAQSGSKGSGTPHRVPSALSWVL